MTKRDARLAAVVLAAIVAFCVAKDVRAEGTEGPPLQLETKIPLGDVRGRIDHMTVDLARHRLFVAALGNDSLAVVDIEGKRLDRLIGGLREPQGVGYDPVSDTLYVANAGDGSVRLFKGAELLPAGKIELGDDADNVRVDSEAGRIFVGYGGGGLAIIDGKSHDKVASVPLKAHPESFQLDGGTGRIFVNVPNGRAIDVIDRAAARKIASWPTASRSANFAMALDPRHQQVLVAFRRPAELGVFSMADGGLVASLPTCGDVDDLFVDSGRDRVYLSCGEGFIDVFAADGASYRRIGHIASAAGARTSLFVPEFDRLLLAVPAKAGTAAAIWVFRPLP
jgi:DNA-binding beta-propeller fold protein YncE